MKMKMKTTIIIAICIVMLVSGYDIYKTLYVEEEDKQEVVTIDRLDILKWLEEEHNFIPECVENKTIEREEFVVGLFNLDCIWIDFMNSCEDKCGKKEIECFDGCEESYCCIRREERCNCYDEFEYCMYDCEAIAYVMEYNELLAEEYGCFTPSFTKEWNETICTKEILVRKLE